MTVKTSKMKSFLTVGLMLSMTSCGLFSNNEQRVEVATHVVVSNQHPLGTGPKRLEDKLSYQINFDKGVTLSPVAMKALQGVIKKRLISVGIQELSFSNDSSKEGFSLSFFPTMRLKSGQIEKLRQAEGKIRFSPVHLNSSLLIKYKRSTPSGYQKMSHTQVVNGKSKKVHYILKKANAMPTHCISRAVAVMTESGEWAIALKMNPSATKQLAEVSRKSKGEKLAVLVDCKILTVPEVTESIPNGEFLLTADLTAESANELAIILRTALPTAITIKQVK